MNTPEARCLGNKLIKPKLSYFLAATVVYAGFVVFLYQPNFQFFEKKEYLVLINIVLAAIGCYVLSGRWAVSFWARFFAGALYGFGPFMLGLAEFHPTAGTLAASVPWLFLPAAFFSKDKWRWLQVPLSFLPFLSIIVFFQLSAHWRLFSLPIQSRLVLDDLPGLLAPLVAVERGSTLAGFYHVPIAPLVMGLAMLLAARRFGVIIIFCIALIPAFCNSFCSVSPLIWLTIPLLCCSVMIGEGIQGLASAGFADRRWVLLAAIIMGVLSVIMLLMATKYFQAFAGLGDRYAKLLVETAQMYVLGAIAVIIIFFMIRSKMRMHWLRLVILCSAAALDIFYCAQILVDKSL
ncbi:hypothetical protein ACFL1G_09535 [Planctomycetota bacterium]